MQQLIKIHQGHINPNNIVLVTNVEKLNTMKIEYYYSIKTINNKEYSQYFQTDQEASKSHSNILNQIQTGMPQNE
jgi:hypothetical protein